MLERRNNNITPELQGRRVWSSRQLLLTSADRRPAGPVEDPAHPTGHRTCLGPKQKQKRRDLAAAAFEGPDSGTARAGPGTRSGTMSAATRQQAQSGTKHSKTTAKDGKDGQGGPKTAVGKQNPDTSVLSSVSGIESENFLQKTMDESFRRNRQIELKEARQEVVELRDVLQNRSDFLASQACKELMNFVMEKTKEDPLLCRVGENPYVEEKSCCTLT